ncbi:intramembrane protease 2 [Cordyceps fumosorosea ARSEF 2679]|uniref:Intramembrane protease 2 n=1 Tax=Cordyceps fumosorosea (strain ARSEF 2679) TaxID=1081104 RepID=A0A168D4F2_CORFA|nr:intramembrane protease 2 [Cordyceps fumosorosea ARSEF 2679]OAA72157.1 intramembrane protease 2 [Cordyceps fumosorosea ARSEF 2679]
MATNSSLMDPSGGIMDGLNSTSHSGARAQPETWLATLQDFDFLLLETKLVLSAAGIIYVGAHAALRRPPSAAPPRDEKARRKTEEEDKLAQGLEMSDAILFPVMASVVLVGLYYLIQWLNDPAIISKVLRWYMSIVSVASLVTLYAHSADLLAAFAFPRYWRGHDGVLLTADQRTRVIVRCDDAGNVTAAAPTAGSSNPLPGVLGWLAPTERLHRTAWNVRATFKREWLLRLFLHGVGEEKAHVKFATMMALPLAAATAALYFTTTSPLLSNMLGYGMCYCSFLVLSPTDLLTGSLMLGGLFFYDIFMVFYTPYMVTVATTLDVPIKLQFKAAQRQSILGLGDIVIPGMFVAWALRADLYFHYKRLVKYESTDLRIVEKDAASGELVTRSETKHREVKAPYVEVKGTWGDWFWTRRLMHLRAATVVPPSVAAGTFGKTYFYASMVGYLLGMLATLAMLLVFKRGQPALLYLVPSVLGATYVTAVARGELRDLLRYTEDGSLDTVDVVVELDADGNPVKALGKLENGVVDMTKKEGKDSGSKQDSASKEINGSAEEKGDEKKAGGEGKKGKNHHVFLFSLEAPPDDGEA